MLLKAAYFSVLGVGEDIHLEMAVYIKPAIDLGQGLGIAWPLAGRGHNVRAWAELLILERATHPNSRMAYPTGFDNQVQANGQRISQLWDETLRYHKNKPYAYEIRQVRQAAEWLLVNSELL
jgi:hypothetical protein